MKKLLIIICTLGLSLCNCFNPLSSENTNNMPQLTIENNLYINGVDSHVDIYIDGILKAGDVTSTMKKRFTLSKGAHTIEIAAYYSNYRYWKTKSAVFTINDDMSLNVWTMYAWNN